MRMLIFFTPKCFGCQFINKEGWKLRLVSHYLYLHLKNYK